MTVSPRGFQSLHALLGLPPDASPASINTTYARAAMSAIESGDPARAVALSEAFARLPLTDRRLVLAAGRPGVPSVPATQKSGTVAGSLAPRLLAPRTQDHGFASTVSTVLTAAAAAAAAIVVGTGWGHVVADQFTALAGQLHHLLAR